MARPTVVASRVEPDGLVQDAGLTECLIILLPLVLELTRTFAVLQLGISYVT